MIFNINSSQRIIIKPLKFENCGENIDDKAYAYLIHTKRGNCLAGTSYDVDLRDQPIYADTG